ITVLFPPAMSWVTRQGPQKYPLIDSDPHASRVVGYFRGSDYAYWAGCTAGAPAALWGWEKMDRTGFRMRSQFYVGAWLGFCAGFMIAYSRSSKRFWGWSENSIEEKRDLQELSQRAQEGIPLYGETNQPQWIQAAAHRNSQFSQLKFSLFPMLNLVNHPYHGTDPAKYGVAGAPAVLEDSEGLQPGQTLLSVKKATQSKSE
ncbi:unnamed protein product, partial [Mycena citricolor]